MGNDITKSIYKDGDLVFYDGYIQTIRSVKGDSITLYGYKRRIFSSGEVIPVSEDAKALYYDELKRLKDLDNKQGTHLIYLVIGVILFVIGIIGFITQ